MSYEKHGRGFIAQNLIHNFLIQKGYQVLTEDTTQGLIDLVAIPPKGDVLFIDAKCLARRKDGSKINRILRDNQRQLEQDTNIKVHLIYADIETGEIKGYLNGTN